MTTESDITEQMEQMSIKSPVESVGAWDAIYSYMYPELKREYESNERLYQLMTEPGGLLPNDQEREINRYRNEMMRVIQVRRMLRRLAGYRH